MGIIKIMKSAMIAAGLAGLSSAYQLDNNLGVPISDLTTVEYNTIIFGIAYGFVDKEGFTEFETCISDVKGEAVAAFGALHDLEAHDWTTGFEDLLGIVRALPLLKTDCTSMQDDIAALEAYAVNLMSQTDLK